MVFHKSGIALVMAATLMMAHAHDVAALTFCRCREAASPLEEAEKAGTVFTGTVQEIRWLGGDYDRVYFRVEKSWKGIGSQEKVIFTEHPSIAETLLDRTLGCGYQFEEGQSYLVYSYRIKASPDRVSRCGRTRLLRGAQEELEQLGAPEKLWEE